MSDTALYFLSRGETDAKGSTTDTKVDTAELPHETVDYASSDEYCLTTTRFFLVFIAFSVSFSLIALDQTILSTALATVASDFSAVSDITWIASAYFLPQAGLMLFFGRLLSISRPKAIFVVSILLFEAGSLICAVSPSADVLIFGRAFAGVGAAGLWICIMSVFARVSTLKQRPLLLGAMGAIYAVCTVAGPIIGGALTDKATWRWCFWINLPCGGVAVVLVLLFLPNLPPAERGTSMREQWKRLDYIGAILSIAFVTTLLIPLQWGGNVKPWNDPAVIALLVVSVILIAIFAAWEYRQGSQAILPLSMVVSRNMPGACIEGFLLNLCFVIANYYLPLFYQVKGQSPTHSGIDILPFMLSGVIASFVCGGLVAATGHVWPSLFGPTLLGSVAGGLLFTVSSTTSTATLIGYQILLGVGLGCAIQNTTVVAQAQYAASPHLVSQATSLVTFMQLLGSSLSLAISSAIFSGRLTAKLNAISPPLPQAVKDAVRESVSSVFTLPDTLRLPVMGAYVAAVDGVFLIIVGGAACASLTALLLISRSKVTVGLALSA
ncbi:MFS general substrate transporter [Phanerochaete sordida]|uniref:MFS general substrate transporter n=1 Tax=Phanerochaete sordida TaxID=48140 RepID=A0A9P3GDB5_9APHY|nr:MFS general substrate transporter [Phanerochaete sordida]